MPKQQGPPLVESAKLWWLQAARLVLFPMGGFSCHMCPPQKSDPNKGVEALPLPEGVHQTKGNERNVMIRDSDIMTRGFLRQWECKEGAL